MSSPSHKPSPALHLATNRVMPRTLYDPLSLWLSYHQTQRPVHGKDLSHTRYTTCQRPHLFPHHQRQPIVLASDCTACATASLHYTYTAQVTHKS